MTLSLTDTFLTPFRTFDEGNAGLNITAYNGGPFAVDPALDALSGDCWMSHQRNSVGRQGRGRGMYEEHDQAKEGK
jgi:hypothetical protein